MTATSVTRHFATAGGTVLTVIGTNFVSSNTLSCGFGPSLTSVTAQWLTATMLQSPLLLLQLRRPIQVTSNLQQWTASGLTYTFATPPTVTSLNPTRGTSAGGTTVLVAGTGFTSNPAAVCRFGSAIVSATVSNTTSASCVSPFFAAGAVALEFSNNNRDFTSNAVQYTFVDPPFLSTISPAMGPVAGGTTVTIGGSNFVSGMNVRFGTNALVSTAFVTATRITVTAPATAAGTLAVTAFNGPVASSATLTYVFYANPSVTTLSPNSGQTTGSTLVSVTGTNFQGTATLSCRFGTAVVTATYSTATRLLCSSPALGVGSVNVEVTLNGADYTANEIPFIYSLAPTVATLSPTSGPVTGGTLLTVNGANYVNSGNNFCRVGAGTIVSAAYVSATRVTCTMPSGTAGATAVEVSNNNVDFSSSGIQFTYVAAATVTSVNPPLGPLTSTSVTVGGTNFINSANLRCRFGASVVAAAFVTVTQVTCSSPVQAAGTYSLEVTNNLVDYTSNNVQFLYVTTPAVTSVAPTLGPVSGGTVVTVVGSNFYSTSLLRCRFGATAVTAVFVTATQIQCSSPALAASTNAVEVSVNNQVFTANAVQFQHIATETVTTVSPLFGLTVGNTLVQVSGTNFFNSPLLTCAFGTARVSAIYLSATRVTCMSPAYTAGMTVIEVSNNNQQFTANAVAYQYISGSPAVTITSVVPNNGPVTGGTTVVIQGTGFVSGSSFCRFGTLAAASVTFNSPTQVTVTTPVQVAGSVSLECSNDNVNYSVSTQQFIYFAVLSVSAVSPSLGPRSGNTVVTVTGTAFQNTAYLYCSFGAAGRVLAVYMSATQLLCTSPFSAIAQTVNLEVSNNNADFTTNARTFQMTNIPSVSSLAPTFGPLAGGSNITVNGASFSSPAWCTFGTLGRVIASYISATRLRCQSLSTVVLGSVAVEVSMNNQDFTADAVPFLYVSNPLVLSLSPSVSYTAGGANLHQRRGQRLHQFSGIFLSLRQCRR